QILARESDAEIDHDPLPAALVADAVEGEIHADLAQAAERREYQLIAEIRHQPSLPAAGDRSGPRSWTTSPAAMVRRSPSGSASPSRPASSIASNTPPSSRSASRTRITWPSPAARDCQSVRMVAKCWPSFHWARRPTTFADSAAKSVAAETSTPAAARSVAG